MGISYARPGKTSSSFQTFLYLHKEHFSHSFCEASHLPGGGSEQQQRTAMNSNSPVVQRGKQPQSFLPWRHIWDMNGLFMTLQFCPLPVGPVLCIRKGGGEWQSRESLRSRWLFRWDELGDESSWRNGAKCAEPSRAAVSLPTRAPTGVIEGFNFNYVGSAVVI